MISVHTMSRRSHTASHGPSQGRRKSPNKDRPGASAQMTKKASLSSVHHIGLKDSSPNSIATINTKLVKGESTVLQQILSAGVDWINPDVLKFIDHKAEELMSEGKVTELPAASAYGTLIIPSKSKPTKPHINVECVNGKVECQDCQGYSVSCLCAHAAAASLKEEPLRRS